MQGNAGSVKHSVGACFYPFAQVYIVAFSGQFNIHRQVSVPKYQVVEKLGLQYFFAVNNQPFLLVYAALFIIIAGYTAMLLPSVGYAYAKIGMHALKKPLTGRTTEYLFQKFILSIARAEAIAVVQVEFFAAALYHQFIADDGCA